MKHPASFRLTPEALRLLAVLASKLGISQAAALGIGIRDLAKKRKVE